MKDRDGRLGAVKRNMFFDNLGTTERLPDVITWENSEISYHYYCSRRRRTLSISVFPDRSVVVRAPWRTSRKTIREFVLSRADWIVRVLSKLDQHPPQEPLSFRSGATLHYAGRQFRLEVRRGEKESVTCLSNRLLVTTRTEPTEERARDLLDLWYRSRADILFHERLSFCADLASREGIPLPEMRIRKMKSRWGSFSPGRGITLNLVLVMVPVEYLDYVILHELCHHKVAHHGPKFWELLKRLMPDCKARKEGLNAYASRLNTI
jgi:predicted metal-dependent hydrolase